MIGNCCPAVCWRPWSTAVVGVVLSMLHESPEHDWTLDSMAELAHLSRSAFALRFVQVVGMPLTYLTHWRMAVARNLLAQGQAVKAVASLRWATVMPPHSRERFNGPRGNRPALGGWSI